MIKMDESQCMDCFPSLPIIFHSMFSLFKRPERVRERTFKVCVEEFWDWFASRASFFSERIEARQCTDLADEVGAKVGQLLPGFSWVFGPGENGIGHSFTLTAEGDRHKQLLAAYWRDCRAHIPGWTFYASRQPSPEGTSFRMQVGDVEFNPLEFWITPILDQDNEQIDLCVWHPRFGTLSERQCWTVLFLMLDETLGELGTQNWIGAIDLTNNRLTESMPISELPAFVREVEQERGWRKFRPGVFKHYYQYKEPREGFLRSDIVSGFTRQIELHSLYMESEGRLDDPLAETGADYVFACFPLEYLPVGREGDVRLDMEYALADALEVAHNGRCLGSAIGVKHVYLDALIFDGSRSIETLCAVLRALNLPRETTIHYFAKQKAHLRVPLGQ